MGQIRVGIVGTSLWADAMYLPSLACFKKTVVSACLGLKGDPARQLASNLNNHQKKLFKMSLK